MSVATKNPFALLDAEGASRPASPAPAAAQAPPAPPAPARGNQKPRGGPAARGGKYYARGGANKPAQKDANPNQNGVEEPVAGEGQRRFENRGRGGRGGARGAPRGGRRPFDKHSQTGKIDSDKKIQQSWGGADGNTELKNEQEGVVDAAAEGNEWAADSAPAAEWGTPAAAEGDTAPAAAEGEKAEGRPRREREPEEEDNTLTLDQYLAQQKEKESAIPKLESTRQANEGADVNIWKDVVALEKGEEDAYFVGKTKSTPKARAKKEEKVFLEIEARFERPDRGGRGRGGRGGDRGGDRARGAGRGRGGARAPRQANNAPVVNVDDQTAFPSLS
ncbi:hypothetical protein DXG03_007064 [Asterophora parasitica]|uniref:Hyaluronan/mRNA-binding protein domain-containing protein n=1 Tax=Asterophora parasitica TaxID=117018 RepID=A0A9P7KFY7_9AGAR|nr:hypothetical protein DXG03_007064 [Asterophora parasitica]